MSLNEFSFQTQFNRRYVDKVFWVLFIALILAALLALFSAGSTLVYRSTSTFGPIGHQFMFILAGAGIAAVLQFLPSWMIKIIGYGLLALNIIFLWLMLIPHNPFVISLNGAGRWFRLAGFSFQPSEFAKISLMIVVADQLARMKEGESKKYFWRTLFISGATIFPILVGNLSTAVLMGGIVFLLWIISGINWRYYISTLVVLIMFAIAGYFVVEFAYVRTGREVSGLMQRATTWVGRVDDFLAEKQNQSEGKAFELTDDNYQRSLAKVAVARGGISPIGVLPGNSKERDFLPLAYADYIFAIIVEETGIVGAALLILIYLAILFRACWVSTRFGAPDAMLMMMGVALMLTCQALISMAVAVGIGPVTGQPLPLITMGGSSSLATALYFGVLMAISREQNQMKDQQDLVNEASQQDIPEIVDL